MYLRLTNKIKNMIFHNSNTIKDWKIYLCKIEHYAPYRHIVSLTAVKLLYSTQTLERHHTPLNFGKSFVYKCLHHNNIRDLPARFNSF